jgi:hypothetical protein
MKFHFCVCSYSMLSSFNSLILKNYSYFTETFFYVAIEVRNLLLLVMNDGHYLIQYFCHL